MTSIATQTPWPTIQALGTLDVLCHGSPLFWETAKQGKFSLWSLLIAKGFVKPTDPELVLEHWQNIERWGTATDQTIWEYEYAPSRDERRRDKDSEEDWNEAIATQRQAIYAQIQQLLASDCQDQQAYKLAVPSSLKGHTPDFWVSMILAELSSEKLPKQWLCLVPTTPDELYIHDRDSHGDRLFLKPSTLTSPDTAIDPTFAQSLSALLESLQPIEIYGYYHGGYHSSYHHRIVGAIGSSQAEAVSRALSQTGMLIVETTAVESREPVQN